MPVSFLRTPADYLGINEAPQQPLFQQTNALQQGADDAMGFFNQMVGLRQQRPLAQAQAIQNQYSTIFNNAEKLRLEQQAAREAEQAVSALAGLTPEVDDYITQRQEIQRQFPNAMLDPRVQRIVDDNDRMFSARQSSLAKQQEDMMKRREELQILGVPPDMAEKAAQSRDATAQLKFQYSKGSAKDITGQAMKEDLELTDSRIKRMVDAGTDVIQNEDGTVSPNPKFQSLVEKSDRLFEELSGFYQGKYRPATTAPVAQEAVTPPAAPAPDQPSGIQVKQPRKPTTEEQIAAVKQLTDNPTALMQVIRSDGGIEAKKEALSKLQEFQKKLPTFQFQSGTPEEIDFIRRNLPNMVNEAKEVIDLEPFKQEVNKAWTTEKNNMASQIKDFAKALNVSPSLVEYWLANNVRYKTEGDPLSDAPARDISIREYFDEYLQNRVGKSLREEADIMSRFSGSKYASRLGIGNKTLAKALFTQALAPFLGPLAGDVAPGGKGPTYEKMLDAYLDEKLNLKPNPVAPQNGDANVGGVPKIQIGTPIKTSS